jgi:hypothetical protein
MFSIGEAPAFSGDVEELASGGAHLCARLRTGAVECVGMEGYLGDGAPLPKARTSGWGITAEVRGKPVTIFPLTHARVDP